MDTMPSIIHSEAETVRHDVYEHGRFYTLEYRQDGISSAGVGLWSFRISGHSDAAWRPVQLLRIRRLLDAENHPRAGEYMSVWHVIDKVAPYQLDQWHDEQMNSRRQDETRLERNE